MRKIKVTQTAKRKEANNNVVCNQENRFKLDAFSDYDRDEFHMKVEFDLEEFEKQCDFKSNW